MEPVEINAGQWYLRALRSDERVDDSPTLTAHGIAEPSLYVQECAAGWASEQRFTWAVCEPSTGEMLGEVTAVPDGNTAELSAWCLSGHNAAVVEAYGAVERFISGGLGFVVHHAANRPRA
ncbi:hypothetical protein IEU95_04315 [Hoyosella rhizosphaerae]|uniref:Uncharacterized protein n=1 Tax=Hoyosella rhizosphaerae TaxID=1755582 RepID=A0A916UAQ5_9ACTN|nr:hypothetical protein [Hoyosella rhizosphaerae]MBN4926039.1 hypothetical protein [Hoyosella rhizosphaerae]GGC66017.1 hypothetical protein GCM10011410_18230 [Hoyosella rhizosphaerae]